MIAEPGGHPTAAVGRTGDRPVLVLASASPARRETLRRAGIEPVVVVSAVDETEETESQPERLAGLLATRKARDVAAKLAEDAPAMPAVGSHPLVLGCDSVLDVDGSAHGKPGTAAVAAERLSRLRGRSAVLYTGHHVIDVETGREVSATASTLVTFADFSDREIAAYVATGEPLHVAGAFTIDGLGGAFVERVEGDPHNVVGLSLPLLRRMLAELDVAWPDLWNRR